ncbi:MAG: cell division protein FtsX [Fusobacteriota bacterium]
MVNFIRQVCKENMQNIKDEKYGFASTILTLSVIFIILNLSIAGVLNLNKLNSYIKDNMQVEIYLEDNLTQVGIENLEKNLLQYEGVESIKYISKEIALEKLSNDLDMNFNNIDNPLQDQIVVIINTQNIDSVIDNIRGEVGVQEVEDKSEFIKRLSRFTYEVKGIIYFIILIISSATFVLLFKLIHSTIAYRRSEIELKYLLGASRSQIKLPFILEGVTAVLLSTLISIGVFIPLYTYLRNKTIKIIPFYNTVSSFEVIPKLFIYVFLIGSVITALASYISIKLYLNVDGD